MAERKKKSESSPLPLGDPPLPGIRSRRPERDTEEGVEPDQSNSGTNLPAKQVDRGLRQGAVIGAGGSDRERVFLT